MLMDINRVAQEYQTMLKSTSFSQKCMGKNLGYFWKIWATFLSNREATLAVMQSSSIHDLKPWDVLSWSLIGGEGRCDSTTEKNNKGL